MREQPDILKLRVLLCFLRAAPEECTVTGIAHMLYQEKYKISRVFMALEREGLMDRTQVRSPNLTPEGLALAHRYARRVELSLNHLLSGGVELEHALQDAYHWALFCSDQTMDAIQAWEIRQRIKRELGERRRFGGALLCRRLPDGSHPFPFLLYQEHPEHGGHLSPANSAFAHPCTLSVRKGQGVIQLRATPQLCRTSQGEAPATHWVSTLRYLCAGQWMQAEGVGGVFSLPAHALDFEAVGAGPCQLLHGSVPLRLAFQSDGPSVPNCAVLLALLI